MFGLLIDYLRQEIGATIKIQNTMTNSMLFLFKSSDSGSTQLSTFHQQNQLKINPKFDTYPLQNSAGGGDLKYLTMMHICM